MRVPSARAGASHTRGFIIARKIVVSWDELAISSSVGRRERVDRRETKAEKLISYGRERARSGRCEDEGNG